VALSSLLTKITPFPSGSAASGLPPSASVPTTFCVRASIAVVFALPPLNVNTRPEAWSYVIASGLRCSSLMRFSTASVFVSNTVTLESRPLLVNPRPTSFASATPCTPGVSGMSPTTLSVFASTTCTCVPCETNSRLESASNVM
jgi:hypothetical protein